MAEQANPYTDELKKYLKADVTVHYHEGGDVKIMEGNLRGINFSTLSCVLMTENEKFVIKNISKISRIRDKVGR